MEATSLDSLERDFQEVLAELVGDKSLERFRQEYEKLHRALKKSHESEKRLIKKCRELNAEIVSNAAKVQTALKLSQEDQSTIASLKREIEKAWKMVDASHEKEARAKDTISQLKTEIANLSRLVEQGAGLSVGQETQVNDLLRDKDALTKERDAQVAEIGAIRQQITDYLQNVRAREQERIAASQEAASLKELISTRKAEGDREARRRERLDKEVKDVKALLESRAQELRGRNDMLAQSEATLSRLEESSRVQRVATEKMMRELELTKERISKLQGECAAASADNTKHAAANNALSQGLKRRDEEILGARQDVSRQTKHKDARQKLLKQVEEERIELRKLQDSLRSQLATLEREHDLERKEAEVEARAQAEVKKEVEELVVALERQGDTTQRQLDISKLNASMIKQLEKEISNFKWESMKQRKSIYTLEKDREKLGAQASDAGAKYMLALEEVKLREMTMVDLQKKISEGDARLKQQQSLYEAVRSDRNLYSKNLIESQDEIAEMKRKFKIMNHQIEQLKEEIGNKDQAFVKEHIERTKAEKEKEAQKNELMRVKRQVFTSEAAMKNFEAERAKLDRIIDDADRERFRQKTEYDIVINERDILGTQLIRRNDELALLYEKMKTQQRTISKGELAYRERLEDLRVLRLKASALRRELHIAKSQTHNLSSLREEVYRLQLELMQERIKVKALSEELENPNNKHRWRKLEGSDPGTYEMLQKIQALQKRLILKTEEVVEKDLLIQEKDKLYVELKNILARQPGPEVAEQLSIYQQGLRDKTKSMKAMASELNMYQAQVNEFKYEMERLTRELQGVKREYYEQKRRETVQRQKQTLSTAERDFEPSAG
jgi:chromosome segregation ATPase